MRMAWASKVGVVIALFAGLVAAVWIIWAVGFGDVWAAIAQAGFTGLVLLCLYAAVMLLIAAFGWACILPREQRPPLHDFYIARLVRDSIGDLSPFSPLGGMVAGARLMIVKGMNGVYASAAVAIDYTTEAIAQVVFLGLGLAIAVATLSVQSEMGPLLQTLMATLLLAVPAIFAMILLQKRGAGFFERITARFFPQMKDGVSFGQAIHDLYESPARLAASTFWHLIGWLMSGGACWLSFRLVGVEVSLLDAMAIEALLCTLRSMAVFVPAAVGVQEGGYAALAAMFGLPPESGVAVSLLKRAREIVLGVPALIYWQSMEAAALRAARAVGGAP